MSCRHGQGSLLIWLWRYHTTPYHTIPPPHKELLLLAVPCQKIPYHHTIPYHTTANNHATHHPQLHQKLVPTPPRQSRTPQELRSQWHAGALAQMGTTLHGIHLLLDAHCRRLLRHAMGHWQSTPIHWTAGGIFARVRQGIHRTHTPTQVRRAFGHQ